MADEKDDNDSGSELEKVHALAVRRYVDSYEHWRDNFELADEDFKFVAGEQYPEEVLKYRENRASPLPCLTFNKLHTYISQVVGDARQNKHGIRVSPGAGDSDVDVADVLEGLIRKIESDSSAANVYMSALERNCAGGIGGNWVVESDYESPESFNKVLSIRFLSDPYSVIWDHTSTDPMRYDAEYCFIEDYWSVEEYHSEFGEEESATEWKSESYHLRFGDWACDDSSKVLVCYYYVKVTEDAELVMLEDGSTMYADELAGGIEELVIQRRDTQRCTIKRYLLSGEKVLEKPVVWPGKKHIPVVSTTGPEEYLSGTIRYRSLIRYSKDASRMYNYWANVITEKIMKTPKPKWLVSDKMIEGYEQEWAEANDTDNAYLRFNESMTGAQPQQIDIAAVNSAELAQLDRCDMDIKATIGIFDAGMGAGGNEISGAAIRSRQRESDSGTFAFIDNLYRGVERTARILIDAIPEVYDGEQMIRIVGKEDEEKEVAINQTVRSPEIAQETGLNIGEIVNDLARGTYDVNISLGSAFSTKRQDAVESMTEFMRSYPAAAGIMGDLYAKAQDWPWGQEISDRLKKTIPPEILEDENEAPQPPPPPTPQQQLELQKQQLELAEAQTNLQKAEAQTEEQLLQNAERAIDLAYKEGTVDADISTQAQALAVQMLQQFLLQQSQPAAANPPPEMAQPGPFGPQIG